PLTRQNSRWCLVSERWWFGVGWWVGVVVVGEALLEFFPCGGEGVDEPGGDEVAFGLTLLMLTPELAGRADLREGCPYGKAEKVHAGVPSGGGGAGAGYGSADRARGRGDRRGCATAGSLGPAGTRAARSASEPGDA